MDKKISTQLEEELTIRQSALNRMNLARIELKRAERDFTIADRRVTRQRLWDRASELRAELAKVEAEAKAV
jgi:hypothetical protein